MNFSKGQGSLVSSLIIWVGGWSKLTFAVKIGLGDFFSFNLHLQSGVYDDLHNDSDPYDEYDVE